MGLLRYWLINLFKERSPNIVERLGALREREIKAQSQQLSGAPQLDTTAEQGSPFFREDLPPAKAACRVHRFRDQTP